MPQTTTYEFTAFTEADLLQGATLAPGWQFSLDGLFAISLQIVDQDRFLSGLNRAGQVRDRIGQTDPDGGDAQYYAGARALVLDQDGNRFRLVEISQTGSDADHFTFNGALPDAGAKLTVISVRDGSGLRYDRLGAGGSDDQTALIKGRYFCDVDDDDVYSPDDPLIADMLVTLMDAAGTVIARTTTGADGSYVFENLAAGTYQVMFQGGGDSGKHFVAANTGSDDSVDSDVTDLQHGTTDVFVLGAGEAMTGVDAGIAYDDPSTSSLGGRYFCDDDDDGIEGPDDPGVSGMTVVLFDGSGQPVDRTTTADDGTYVFDDLTAGDYVVMFASEPTKDFVAPDAGGNDAHDSDVTNSLRGTTDVIALGRGEDITGVNAGIVYPPDDFAF